jgi:hypothetical protein
MFSGQATGKDIFFPGRVGRNIFFLGAGRGSGRLIHGRKANGRREGWRVPGLDLPVWD